MRAVYSPLHERHQGGLELYRGELVPTYETPERVRFILAALEARGHEIVPPRDFPEERLLRVHDADYLAFLRGAWARWSRAGRGGSMLPSGFPARGLRRDRIPKGVSGQMGYYCFDASTPIVEGTWEAVEAAARSAMTAAALVLEGDRASYALCRPPGHHASRDVYGGYCFLNNAALAAQVLIDGGRRRVALLDVDYHHGNGTQEIFYERNDVHYHSIHVDPGEGWFPHWCGFAEETGTGDGAGANLNLPLAPGSDDGVFLEALDRICADMAGLRPSFMVVSLGVDAGAPDPESPLRVSNRGFAAVGERLASLGLPTVLVQEGGYNLEALGPDVMAVLAAFR